MEKIKYILLIIVFPMIMSCEKFLDRPPLDEVGIDNYWKTATDLENYVVHFYPRFKGHSMVSDNNNRYYDETASDNIIYTVPNNLLDGSTSPAPGRWISDWDDIRSVNIFLDNYTKCEDPFSSYQHFVGEAYFFKAWFYFNLVQQYGDVPWYTHALTPDDEAELLRPRDLRTLVVDSIVSQLDKAIQFLDTRTKSENGNTRITKEAALAFKTRVALYEGTWQKYHNGTPFGTPGANPQKYFQVCVNAAEELMNGNYKVGIYNTGHPATDYHNLFNIGNMTPIDEVLLYRAYSIPEGITHEANGYATLNPVGYGLTWGLVTSYLAVDGTPYDYKGLASTTKGNAFLTQIANDCDPRLRSTIWIPGELMFQSSGLVFDKPGLDKGISRLNTTGFQCRTFARSDIEVTGPVNDAGWIILRYAEVLLNYAEAKYELDGTVATTQLNLLRARAGMPDFTVNPQSTDLNPVDYGYSISDALYEIRRERRIETAILNFRESDWKRWAAHSLFKGKRPKGYPFDATEFPGLSVSLDENGLIDPFKTDLPNGYEFRPGQDYLSSIPQTELVLNPNLTQNPGWEN